jgi:hypothetical protein
LELQLIEEPRGFFGATSERLAAEFGDEEFQVGDFDALSFDQRLEGRNLIGQRRGVDHAPMILAFGQAA